MHVDVEGTSVTPHACLGRNIQHDNRGAYSLCLMQGRLEYHELRDILRGEDVKDLRCTSRMLIESSLFTHVRELRLGAISHSSKDSSEVKRETRGTLIRRKIVHLRHLILLGLQRSVRSAMPISRTTSRVVSQPTLSQYQRSTTSISRLQATSD